MEMGERGWNRIAGGRRWEETDLITVSLSLTIFAS